MAVRVSDRPGPDPDRSGAVPRPGPVALPRGSREDSRVARDLELDWRRAALAAGCTATAQQLAAAGADLVRRWSQPHRHYHDLRHLAETLDGIDVLAAEAAAPATVRLAAWFHDAVYAGRPGADERDSARLGAQVLARLGTPGEVSTQVARLVRLTAGHVVEPGDRDGAVLCDADLAVLAAPPERYADYARGVRAEYAAVPEAAFRAGRLAVLQGLAGRSPLFRTRTGRQRWEAAARVNLAQELARLGAIPGAAPSPS